MKKEHIIIEHRSGGGCLRVIGWVLLIIGIATGSLLLGIIGATIIFVTNG